MNRSLIAIFLALLSGGCISDSGGQTSQNQSLGRAKSDDPANCLGVGYANQKVAALKGELREPIPPPSSTNMRPTISEDTRIQFQDKQLPSLPPELLHVQRGATQSWVGGFINDGLSSFTAIDLDRNVAISISRRTRALRPGDSAPLAKWPAPSFARYDTTSFVRSYSGERMEEMEVVTTAELEYGQREAFVCIANALWNATPDPNPVMPTDTLQQSGTLHDRIREGGKWFAFQKSYEMHGPLSIVFGSAFPSQNYQWPPK
jgi:hypothetical protein